MEEELLRFTIPGNPVTKKTHQRIMRVGGYPRIFPSKQYEEYEITLISCLEALFLLFSILFTIVCIV